MSSHRFWSTPLMAGSLIAAGNLTGAAVARRETIIGLGVDVERADPLEASLVPRICSPAEITRLARLPVEEADWHKLVFSAKESVYKAYYPLARTFLEFHDVDVVVEPDAGTFTATLVRRAVPLAAGTLQW